MNKTTIISKSILGGLMIGIGNIIYIAYPNKFIGALLFSLGLTTIIYHQYFLFTGKIGFYKTIKPINLFIILITNILISGLIVYLYYLFSDNSIREMFLNMAYKKTNEPIPIMFINAILCGILMFTAVKPTKDNDNKISIIVLCVMTFILGGFRHCIADSFILFLIPNVNTVFTLLIVILGNSLGSILVSILNNFNK